VEGGLERHLVESQDGIDWVEAFHHPQEQDGCGN